MQIKLQLSYESCTSSSFVKLVYIADIKPCLMATFNFQKNTNLQVTDQYRVDRASAIEKKDSSSIPGRVKPKTITIAIHSFPA